MEDGRSRSSILYSRSSVLASTHVKILAFMLRVIPVAYFKTSFSLATTAAGVLNKF